MDGKRDTDMKKAAFYLLLVVLIASGAAWAQRLRAGEQILFLKSGDTAVGGIVDFSAPRMSLTLADGTEIALRDLWLVNFVNEDWDFPHERNLIETGEHYVFLKSGDVASGRIVTLGGEPRAFEFETGERFPLGQIRRIYFSRTVPRGLR
jgi:hypothetical protein